ncbi:hypothetical protein FEF65_09165 [Mariprofundus erugo]|uniref:Uncharacterized protein n=1 Tax=Mariprofundus erugo TaxID=2528639 RepID=A0A5R9GTW6_9PROT|nr:hypothetical protein [Mariprofundus erugo]TLS66684.1 hypothetical protein FEF65_09165 [Mariprofundus erugo]
MRESAGQRYRGRLSFAPFFTDKERGLLCFGRVGSYRFKSIVSLTGYKNLLQPYCPLMRDAPKKKPSSDEEGFLVSE